MRPQGADADIARAIKSRVDRYTYRAEWLPDYNEYLGVARPALEATEQPSSTFGLSGFD